MQKDALIYDIILHELIANAIYLIMSHKSCLEVRDLRKQFRDLGHSRGSTTWVVFWARKANFEKVTWRSFFNERIGMLLKYNKLIEQLFPNSFIQNSYVNLLYSYFNPLISKQGHSHLHLSSIAYKGQCILLMVFNCCMFLDSECYYPTAEYIIQKKCWNETLTRTDQYIL